MRNFITAAAVLTIAGAASAAANLQITEIYEGVSGDDITADWIEITNFGDMAYDFGIDGPLYFDDSSADPTVNAELTGFSSIGVGESVVLVLTLDTADVTTFIDTWGAGNLAGVQVGYLLNDDPGLGQGGEQIFLFDDNMAGAGIVDATTYIGSDNGGVAGSTWTWSGDANALTAWSVDGVGGAFQALVNAGDAGEFPLIGSPGAIPAPGAAGLFGLAAFAARRRR